MSQFENVVSNISGRSKQLLNHTADLVEWSAQKNLAIVSDLTSFSVAQIRLPVKAESFAAYQKGVKESYSAYGDAMKVHGADVVARIREVPSEVRDIVAPVAKPAKKAAAPKKAAARKKAA